MKMTIAPIIIIKENIRRKKDFTKFLDGFSVNADVLAMKSESFHCDAIIKK